MPPTPAPQITTSARRALISPRPGTRSDPGEDASEPLAEARVEHVAQAVAEHVDREHGRGQEDAGEQDVVREDAEERAALGHDVAPRGRLGRDADAKER